jgi:DnaJ-class molecular chaperone
MEMRGQGPCPVNGAICAKQHMPSSPKRTMLSWMTVMKMKKCPTCIGIGACGEGDACPTCEGTGEIPTDQVIIDEPCQPVVCLPKSRATSRT